MITVLGYGDRDYRLFKIWKDNSSYPWNYIDYRLHWRLPLNFNGRLNFELNRPRFRILHTALYKSYIKSFRERLLNTKVIVLPGKHRIWEKAAYQVALELELNIVFYEAADRKHIYLSRVGVCGEAQFISKNNNLSLGDVLYLKNPKIRPGLWIFGLLKLDSGEFWKAIFQRFKGKRATLGIDIKDLEFKENSLLVLGQVPWDLNSVVYGLSRTEYINEIRHLVHDNNIENIYYKPHPLYYDIELQAGLFNILKRKVMVISGSLSQRLHNVKICVANNSNGLLEVKINNFDIECVALGEFIYSDLFGTIRDSLEEDLNEIVRDYIERNLLKCDYRDGPNYIESASMKLIENEYESSNNRS